eukprot:3894472-Prorocentrum_lima.AAC.1
MTSSLVGSEMCIRDRSRSPGRCRVLYNDCKLPAGPVPVPGCHESFNSFCLLYTSDAADDM